MKVSCRFCLGSDSQLCHMKFFQSTSMLFPVLGQIYTSPCELLLVMLADLRPGLIVRVHQDIRTPRAFLLYWPEPIHQMAGA